MEMEKISPWPFAKMSLVIVALCLFALPWFNFSVWGASFEVGKKLLLAVAALVALVFWLISQLQENKIILPKNCILLTLGGVLTLSFLSAVFSGNFWRSIVGFGFEQDTFFTLFILLTILFLAASLFQSKRRFLSIYSVLFISALVLFVLQAIVVLVFKLDFFAFGRPFFSFFSNGSISSLVGKWYDFGVYYGFVAISSLFFLEFRSERKSLPSKLAASCLGISLVALVFVNYLPVWVALLVFSLWLFFYKVFLVKKGSLQSKTLAGFSFLVVMVSIFFLTLGSVEGLGQSWASGRTKISGVAIFDVKPSWFSTYQIAKASLAEKPLLGVGPNRFASQWIKDKPASVNQTPYWNINFNFGAGYLPTFAITGGLLMLAGWAAFLLSLLWYGFRLVARRDIKEKPLSLVALAGSIYLWVFSVIYVPDSFLLALTFFVTGLFISQLTENKIIPSLEIWLNRDSKLNLGAVLLILVLVIGLSGSGFYLVQKYVSLYFYQKGQVELIYNKNLDRAQDLVGRAIKLSAQDLYYRKASEIDLAKISNTLTQNDLGMEQKQKQFETLFNSAVANTQKALEIDKKNYLNWLAQGNVYQLAVSLGVEGSYQKALDSYLQAQKLSPTNPSILVDNLARLEIQKGDSQKAKDYLNQAKALKPDYYPAVLLETQLDLNSGDSVSGLKKLEDFAVAYPQAADQTFYFQLGYLKFIQLDYAGAIRAFSQAVALEPDFANAKYFRALSYEALGQRSEALKEFVDIQKTNPDSDEVKQVIQRLKGEPSLGE